MSLSRPRSSSPAGRTVTLPLLNRTRSSFDSRPQSLFRRPAEGRASQNCHVDRIQLEGMSFNGRHGVRPAEREQAQEFRVDIEVEADLSRAGRTDRLEDTIDIIKVRARANKKKEGESVKYLKARRV